MIGADSRTFFQLAATLIPALIFGGILSDRVHPPENFFENHGFWAGVIAFVMFFVGAPVLLATEVIAIAVGLNGQPDEFDIWLVSGVLVAATDAAIVVLFWPWLGHFRDSFNHNWEGIGALVVFTLLLFWVPIYYLKSTIQILPPDPSGELAALDALDKDVAIEQAHGLVSAASARRFHGCIASQRLAIAVNAAELTGWYFRRPSGAPVLPSDPPGSRQARVPYNLANIIAKAEFLDGCPIQGPVYRNPYYRGGTNTAPGT